MHNESNQKKLFLNLFWFSNYFDLKSDPDMFLTSFMRLTQYCGQFVSNTSELPNHHKSISKIRHFTLFILIYSTLLYGCYVLYILYVWSDLRLNLYTL